MARTAPETSLKILISPSGQLHLAEDSTQTSALSPRARRRIEQAFALDQGTGVLQLGAAELKTELPISLAFFRSFGQRFMTALCARADLEAKRERVDVAPPTAEALSTWSRSAPPMIGAEYLTAAAFAALWAAMLSSFQAAVSAHQGSVQSYLQSKDTAWNLVGRVCFHLAENKKDPERPFAFLATFTSGLSKQGRPQHIPLGRALTQYSGEAKRAQLQALIEPVQRAARQSDLIADLVERRDIFRPQAWTPGQAYEFFREAPLLEECGVVMRMPTGWANQRPARAKVSVKIGATNTGKLMSGSLLDFSIDVALGATTLKQSEIKKLLSSTEGLILLKGQWVEVDPEALEQVLARWRRARHIALSNGLTFAEGMRLLAKAHIGEDDEEDEAQLHAWSEVVAGPWLERQLAKLRAPQALQAPRERDAFEGQLRPYQEIGRSWLWHIYSLGLGACLADDMGLGKTIQVLALLATRKNNDARAPALLVAPASLITNWRDEMKRFTPGLTALIAHPSETPREQLSVFSPETVEGVDLVITTYAMLRRIEGLSSVRWGVVVFDEAQALKNPRTKQTRAARALDARSKILLTGTPVENRLSDLWSLFNIACPGLLGSNKEFTDYVNALNQATSEGMPDFTSLRALIQPYILRRLKSDQTIIKDLPDKIELRVHYLLSKKQASLYQRSVEALEEELQVVGGGKKRRGVVLSYLMRFKQICNHPSQWLGDEVFKPADSGKFTRLRALCEEIASRQEKALIFTQFKQMTAPLEVFLRDIFGQKGLVLHGGTSIKRRAAFVESFQREDGPPFFVISLKAGGTGLNLTAATHVIHFDRWWNPAVEDQATDRVYRIGQKKNVLVHKFVCRGTIEERIDELIHNKRELASQLLGGSSNSAPLTELSDEALLELVRLDLQSATQE